jgi:hypothetical protein
VAALVLISAGLVSVSIALATLIGAVAPRARRTAASR